MKAMEQYQQQALPPVAGMQAVQKDLRQALDAARKAAANK
jgi:hypothetical protein